MLAVAWNGDVPSGTDITNIKIALIISRFWRRLSVLAFGLQVFPFSAKWSTG
jgi:hypothetical protein